MHVIGFSHHYTKLHNQSSGILVYVRSTEKICPSGFGIYYDTEYETWEKGFVEDTDVPLIRLKETSNYPLKPEDFDKPLLQLVFIGAEHQIPFTTYREFPNDYKPFYPNCCPSLPYADLIGDTFAFKFKGEELPKNLATRIDENAVRIFN